MAKYTQQYRAACIAMLEGAGYPENPYKLEEIAKHLKLPSRTLRRWYKGEVDALRPEVVRQQKQDLAEIYEDIAYKLLAHAGDQDVIDDMSGKDAVLASGIATDKMRLLRGLPTEIIAVLPELLSLAKAKGVAASDLFQAMIAELSRADHE